jgi:hypothetical protein
MSANPWSVRRGGIPQQPRCRIFSYLARRFTGMLVGALSLHLR